MANERYEGVGLNGHYTLAERIFTKIKGLFDTKVKTDVPANAVFTDEKVKQNETTSEAQYEILFSGTADDVTRIEETRKHSKLLYNPYTQTLTVGTKEDPYARGVITLRGGTDSPAYLNVDGVISVLNSDMGCLFVKSNDIELFSSVDPSYTWDGVNTSLKDALGAIEDTKVTQTESNSNDTYEILVAGTASTATTTEGANKSTGLRINPYKNAVMESYNTTASGLYSHAEGYQTLANGGAGCHAEGSNTTATGSHSHAEGINTYAGNGSHAEGSQTTAGYYGHAEGEYTYAAGESSHAEGYQSYAQGTAAHAEGDNTTALYEAHAEGQGSYARGNYSHAEGYKTTAGGEGAHAEGSMNRADGSRSHVEGYGAYASGNSAHAEGYRTTANGNYSHSEGYYSKATNLYTHAENQSYASGQYSHSEGYVTTSNGNYSHAEGYGAYAKGSSSHAEGYYTTATHKSQHVFGEFNALDTSTAVDYNRGTYVEIVGNGTNATTGRSNARTLDWDGNEKIAGNLTDKWGLQTSRTMFEEDFQQLTQAERDNGTNYYIPDREPLKICDYIYPVGAIYMSVNNISPAILFGGTWERIKDTFLLAAGDDYTAGSTGGEAEHTLIVDEMPLHDHSLIAGYPLNFKDGIVQANTTSNWKGGLQWNTGVAAKTNTTGSNQPHNNMPPYLAVYMWKRIPDPVQQEEEEGE